MFIEERILECATYGSVMSPTWNTRRIQLKSGIIRRNPLRSRPQYRLTLMYRNLSNELHGEVISAFNVAMGGVHSFRVKDWSDFQVEDQQLPLLGTGGVQHVQLIKVYSFGTEDLTRPIRKPIHSTVVIKANGTPISKTIDDNGVATYTAPNGSVVRWSGEFDVPMMFEEDALSFSGDDKGRNGLFLTADVNLIEDLSV